MSPDLKVNVANFGPVKSGEFRLKPLTLFIGPNNSGKSYMATLVYALTKALAGRLHGPFLWGFGWPRHVTAPEINAEQRRELLAWYAERSQTARSSVISLSTLPEPLKELIHAELSRLTTELRRGVDESIRDYFGTEGLADLARGGDTKNLLVDLNSNESTKPFLHLSVQPGKAGSRLEWSLPDFGEVQISPNRYPVPRPKGRRAGVPDEYIAPLMSMIVAETWSQILVRQGIPVGESYYLPAARSGILQGWQVFASIALQMVRRRVGLQRIDVPPLTGVAGDFLQVLLERLLGGPRRREPPALRSAIDVLEKQIFHGEVSLDQRSAERPLILYKSGGLELPLQRVSSMVGELAPLELWLRHLIDPGELLIIDEPEAHLHPEGQRRMARVLVRLVNAGVRVLCTTHSSLILHQLSNHLLASQADTATRTQTGFTKDDVLSDVAVYLFDRKGDGTHITEVATEPDFGIPEEEFLRVAEAIGEETHRLSSRVGSLSQ